VTYIPLLVGPLSASFLLFVFFSLWRVRTLSNRLSAFMAMLMYFIHLISMKQKTGLD